MKIKKLSKFTLPKSHIYKNNRLKFLIIVILYTFYHSAYAEGDDLLEGTTKQALTTLNNGGRYWAYIIDGAISLAAFAKTKNPFVFASVLGVAFAITLIYKMAGGT